MNASRREILTRKLRILDEALKGHVTVNRLHALLSPGGETERQHVAHRAALMTTLRELQISGALFVTDYCIVESDGTLRRRALKLRREIRAELDRGDDARVKIERTV